MPLYGEPPKPIQLQTVTHGIQQQWDHKKPVFYLALTNEVFDDYEYVILLSRADHRSLHSRVSFLHGY